MNVPNKYSWEDIVKVLYLIKENCKGCNNCQFCSMSSVSKGYQCIFVEKRPMLWNIKSIEDRGFE